MRGDSAIHSYMFKGYLAIPFLYELKLTLDFTFTSTALDLFKWLKFESVYDILFITNCYMKVEDDRELSKNVGWIDKWIGAGSFMILIVIFLGPLILFSGLNPTNVYNNVLGARTNVSISISELSYKLYAIL